MPGPRLLGTAFAVVGLGIGALVPIFLVAYPAAGIGPADAGNPAAILPVVVANPALFAGPGILQIVVHAIGAIAVFGLWARFGSASFLMAMATLGGLVWMTLDVVDNAVAFHVVPVIAADHAAGDQVAAAAFSQLSSVVDAIRLAAHFAGGLWLIGVSVFAIQTRRLPRVIGWIGVAVGAVFGEKNGWERANYFAPGQPGRRQGADHRSWDRPPYFDQMGREHRAVRESVGVLDMTSFGKLDVRGPGALVLLQRLADNDVDKPVGSLIYTQFLNSAGGIECDVTITRMGEQAFRVTTGTLSTASDLGWIVMHLPDDGSVEVEDVTEACSVISVWGPNSRKALQKTTADLSNEAFPYMTSRVIEMGGVEVRANRVSFAGELGYELVVARDAAVRVWDAVMEAGREFHIMPVGYYALNTLRLEKCFYYWGDDICPSDNPLEANLGFCVKLGKAEFIGREALLRLKEAGPTQKLVPLTLDGDACVLYGGEAVLADGKVVSRVRSGGYGYTIGRNIALAYLPFELARPGTRLHIESFDRVVPAEVQQPPLFDPKGERVRA